MRLDLECSNWPKCIFVSSADLEMHENGSLKVVETR